MANKTIRQLPASAAALLDMALEIETVANAGEYVTIEQIQELLLEGSGLNAVLIGEGASATGESSVAIGDSAAATNLYAIALGLSASASGIASLAVGRGATAAHTNGIALGNQAVTEKNGQLMIGSSNIMEEIKYGNGSRSIEHVNPITKVKVGDTSTHLTKDGSGNLVLTDVNAGALTLSEVANAKDTAVAVTSSANELTMDLDYKQNSWIVSEDAEIQLPGVLTYSGSWILDVDNTTADTITFETGFLGKEGTLPTVTGHTVLVVMYNHIRNEWKVGSAGESWA